MTKTTLFEPGSKLSKETAFDPNFLICRAIEPATIQELLHKTGHQAIIGMYNGCHQIESSSNGTHFFITLRSYDEALSGYRQVSLSVKYSSDKDFNGSTQLMNDFNMKHSFVKGFVRDSGDLEVQMDWLIGNGVTVAQISQWLELWRASLVVFENYWVKYNEAQNTESVLGQDKSYVL
jgi:hypothetical protein